jgi:hypothetical protein
MRFLVSSGVDRRAMIRPDDPHYHTITLDVLFHLLGNFDNVIHVYGQQGHNGYIGELEGHDSEASRGLDNYNFPNADENGGGDAKIFFAETHTKAPALQDNIRDPKPRNLKPGALGGWQIVCPPTFP